MPPTPSKLGRYEILEELGKGAMGIVFLARDPLIGRLVALKTFRLGFSVGDRDLQQFRARFIREAQSAGILSHPGIVTIHDVVERSEEGLAFIAMEYVRGTNLKALLQGDTPLELAFVADVIAQIAAALDYAHEHGVVHRDVKPANVILTVDGKVKITDFGIARIDSSNLTQEGQLLGTPNYMAPEQVMGKDVDHRADLFSLGVVVYEMLTGHKPFQGENLTQVSHRIVYEPFTPPEKFVRDLPPPLRAVLEKALEKDPDRRYQAARELATELAAAVAGRVRGDLNETQSVDGFVPLLKPPPDLPSPPPMPDETRVVSSADAAIEPIPAGPPPGLTAAALPFSAEPLPPIEIPEMPAIPEADELLESSAAAPDPPPLEPAPAAPGRPRAGKGGLRPGRLVALVAGAAFLALALASGVLLALAWSGRPLAESTQPDAAGAVVQLRQEGLQRLAAGDAAGAAAALAKAEELAPQDHRPGLRSLRMRATARAQAFAGAAGRTAEIQEALSTARAALVAKRYDEAALAAISILSREPDQPEARAILAKVGQDRKSGAAQTGRAQRAAADRRASQGPETVAERPSGEESAVPPPAAGETAQEATLAISFKTEMAEGFVMVYLNDRLLLRKQFRFVEKTGFLRTRAIGGSFGHEAKVPSGAGQLRVYVTPAGRPAQFKALSANFPGGGTRRLVIDLPSSGVAAINLDY